MSNLVELQDLQKKKQQSNKELPNWIYYDENGTMKVNAQKLGYEVMKEIPMIRANELSLSLIHISEP
ncbi:hypothetical protein KQJ29_16530, partial [Enterococcus sp. S181_ASV_20]|nr:hypothetical protein [Enterococcus sp. S181_ASV_20]